MAKAYNSISFPINDLSSPRKFEQLIYSIFKTRLQDDLASKYDDIFLMTGVGEKGVDILLKRDGANIGSIQCKLNKSHNLSKPEVVKEILKFLLFYLTDKSLINDIDNYEYYFVVSGNFSGPSIKLLSDFSNEILNEPNLSLWIEQVKNKYATLSELDLQESQNNLNELFKKLKITAIIDADINSWLVKYDHISKEFFQQKLVIDNQSISRGIKSIKEIIKPDIENKTKLFLDTYRKAAVTHLDNVKFIGHYVSIGTKPRNIKVTRLYVEPHFTVNKVIKSGNKPIEEFDRRKKRELRIHDVFRRSRHYIILGDPGAGKSLLIKHLIIRILNKRANIGGLINYKNHIPFRIELRNYNYYRHNEGMNFISYLVKLLKTDYQINDINEQVISYIINKKKTIFFFDGLDEIFDLSQKNNVKEDIESFITVNQNVKCIVTSRFIGYHDIQFSENKFYEFAVQNFKERQINKFIEKFYLLQIKNRSERQIEIESCKKQISSIEEELKSNPLILSLMVMLAINKIVIPESKLEVYRSCTNTLVETRDEEEKKLNIKLLVNNKRGTFGKLAFWQYIRITNKKVINRKLAMNAISDYLLEKYEFTDRLSAEEAADHFLKYAERRSIYFDNIFTHKTFLEYYTADHIFRRYHNEHEFEERDKILSTNLDNPAWHVVFELLFSMIDENIDSPKILDKIIIDHLDSENPDRNYFFLSILKNIVNVSLTMQKSIIKNTILLILKGKDIKRKSKPHVYQSSSNYLFSLLFEACANEKIIPILQEVFYELEELIKEDDLKTYFYILWFELTIFNHFLKNENIYKLNNYNNIKKYIHKELILLQHYYYFKADKNFDLITNQIKLYNVPSIFQITNLHYRKSAHWEKTFYTYFNSFNTYESFEKFKKEINHLQKMGLITPGKVHVSPPS